MTAKEFSATLGVQPVTLSRYENGRPVPSDVLAGLLRMAEDLDLHWLLTGSGTMFRDRDVVPDPGMAAELKRVSELLDLVRAHALTLRTEIIQKTRRIEELETELAALRGKTDQEAG